MEGREQAAEELLDCVVVEFEDEYCILLLGARFSSRSLGTREHTHNELDITWTIAKHDTKHSSRTYALQQTSRKQEK